jgi:hypothetical protein
MRKEAVLLIVLVAIGWCAAPASASSSVVAHWSLDEGSGQLAADSGPGGAHARLGSSAGADANDPSWTAGHDGSAALAFAGSQYVAIPDSAALEPQHVAVDAWVRRSGSPGEWRYVLSKGSLDCDHSAYGLYSGWAGGMSFYVSSATHYTISPEVPASLIWNGAWHHVVGAYDGSRVRLWVDGAQVGDGTPATVSIAYGVGSKGVYIGTYRGSCELGFKGDIDDVLVWDGAPQPPDPTIPVIPPTPGTPTTLPIPGGGAAPGGGGSSSQQHAGQRTCMRVGLSRRTVPVGKRTRVVATVRRDRRAVVGVRVLVTGAGVAAGGRTNRVGRAGINVRALRRGRLTVRIRNEKTGCPAQTFRAG